MKQNITISLDREIIKKARILAAKNATSISRLIGDELTAKIIQEERYQQAHRQALADLNTGFHFGGKGIQSRDALHER